MTRILWLVLLVSEASGVALAQTQSVNELRRMFDYDQNAQLDVKVVELHLPTGCSHRRYHLR